MVKTKIKPTNIFNILFNGIIIYLKNFLSLTRAMIFPVSGHFIGIFLIIYPTMLYREHFLLNLSGDVIKNYLILIFLGLILLVIPGFGVLIKAFWDYIIVLVSTNTMIADIIEKGDLGNFKYHNGAVKLRSKSLILLIIIIMLIWLLPVFPFFLLLLTSVIKPLYVYALFILSFIFSIIFLAVISVYLCLCYQIFAFEPVSPIESLKKSWIMIEGNFWRTFLLGVILFVITGTVLPLIFQVIISKSPFFNYFTYPFREYLGILSENPEITQILEQANTGIIKLAEALAVSSIGIFVTMLVLPLGSACFTLLYFDIKGRKEAEKPKAKRKKS